MIVELKNSVREVKNENYYWPDGKPWYKCTQSKGKIHGYIEWYHRDNGEISFKCSISKSKPSGYREEYHENGNLSRKEIAL